MIAPRIVSATSRTFSVKEDSEENLEIPQAKGKIEKNINNKVTGLTKFFNRNKKPTDLLGLRSKVELSAEVKNKTTLQNEQKTACSPLVK